MRTEAAQLVAKTVVISQKSPPTPSAAKKGRKSPVTTEKKEERQCEALSGGCNNADGQMCGKSNVQLREALALLFSFSLSVESWVNDSRHCRL